MPRPCPMKESAWPAPCRGRALVAKSLLAAASILGIGSAPTWAQGEIGNFCIEDFISPANCTGHDVETGTLLVQQVIEGCAEGVPLEAEVVFDGLVMTHGPARYGIGGFISLDGGDARTGDICLHTFLSPVHPSTDEDDWPTDGMGNFIEPFPNINGDACGDIPHSATVRKTIQPVRIACTDTDGDGFVDVSACASWENNQNLDCNGDRKSVV